MPSKEDFPDKRTGLALSGGGFRAALYHCGTLIRLNELGYLPKLDRITSVSGGSIVSGRLAVAWDRLNFDANGTADNLTDEVVDPLRKFCRRKLDVRSVVAQILPFGQNAVGKLIEAYDELFEGAKLDALPKRPNFIIMSTNLQTGRNVRFSDVHIADYLLGEILDVSRFRLSQAVAASSAFPPVLSPVTLLIPNGAWSPMEGAKLFGQSEYSKKLRLTDGGVYDNLGLERIDHLGTVLCSDAGAPFSMGGIFKALSPKQVLRALDIATDQSRGLRKRHLIGQAKTRGQSVAYWGIDQPEMSSSPEGTIPRTEAIKSELAHMRTRLNPFSAKEQGRLINWGYASCDERIRRYLLPDAPPPTGLPEPDWPLTG